MIPQPVIQLFGSVSTARERPFKDLVRRIGSGRFGRTVTGPVRNQKTDAYLLVLLADQELTEGREEQARYLVEAAYEYFDQTAAVTRS